MIKSSLRKKLAVPLLIVLAIIAILGLRASIRHFTTIENKTPIPPGPEFVNQVTEPADHSKIKAYEKELEENKHAVFKTEPDLQAVSIPWDKVFEQDIVLSMEEKDTTHKLGAPVDSTVNEPLAANNKKKARNTKQAVPGFNTFRPKAQPEDKGLSTPGNELILAVVHGDQKVGDNQPVSFRVIEEIKIGDWYIPRNTIIYGKARASGNRLLIRSGRIKTPTELLNLPLHVLDKDLMEGLFIQNDQLASDVQSIGGEILQEVAVYEYTGIVRSITSAFRLNRNRSLWLMDGYQVYFEYRSD